MTPERQNEIWVILPHWLRKHLRDEYDNAKDALALDPNNPRIQSQIRFLERYFGQHNLTAQVEAKPKEPNHIADSSNMVDYAQYRLDLAKEIVVAMITKGEKPGLCSRTEKAVDMANDIVKRLKETEI